MAQKCEKHGQIRDYCSFMWTNTLAISNSSFKVQILVVFPERVFIHRWPEIFITPLDNNKTHVSPICCIFTFIRGLSVKFQSFLHRRRGWNPSVFNKTPSRNSLHLPSNHVCSAYSVYGNIQNYNNKLIITLNCIFQTS